MSIGITTANLNFDTLREIGQDGKNSQVYLALDKQLDAEIVIKKIDKKTFGNSAEFYAEAKKLYNSEHQNVVQIKYACEDSDYIYLAMPYYSKGSLKTLINSRFLTAREIIRYGIQFLSGLNNIHIKKLIHFDIKPDNILISDSNEAMVSDFGLTKHMNIMGVSRSDGFYMKHIPPEAFAQTEHTMLYDIYNSGLTLYRMCNGNDNFNSQLSKYHNISEFKNAVLNGEFPNRNSYLPHIPKMLRKIINKALSVDQTMRHQTILELTNELAIIPNSQNLDWQCTRFNDRDEWRLDCNDKYFSVTFTWNNNEFNIETLKTMKNNSTQTRVTAHCHVNIDKTIINKTLQSILSDYQ